VVEPVGFRYGDPTGPTTVARSPVRAVPGLPSAYDGDSEGIFDGAHHSVGDFLDLAEAVNLSQDAAPGVLRHHGFGLLVVQIQSVADNGFIVVAAARLLGSG